MTITPKTYTGCPRKHAAREATIIDVYKQFIGPSLPEDKQYWSMCALCADESGILEDSELDQVIKAGLITPNQFHGVDSEQKIHKKNQLYKESNWYGLDFLTAMKIAQHTGNFNPAIVNADLINMTDKGAIHAGRILNFLYENNHTDTMFVLNVVIKAHNRFSSVKELIDNLCKNAMFRLVWSKKKWKVAGNSAYTYNGTQPNKKTNSDAANPKTVMGTLVFIPNKDK
jgi:hypothetical protein